jgi:iron complex outermembrane receptor protein
VPTDDGGALPEYRVEAVRARLHGFELEGRWRVLDAALKLDLSALLDQVRGTDLDHGMALPRIAPGRARLALDAAAGAWAAGVSVQRTAAQRRVAAGDTATPGHTLWAAWATWRPPQLSDRVTAFLRLDNLTDRLAYNAVAAPTVRGLAPLGGRAASAGLRVQW